MSSLAAEQPRRTPIEPALELWAGHECTINRIDAEFHDQSTRTGHDGRDDDLARFKSLGISRLRYPVLWEKVSPDHPDKADWSRSDRALGRLAELAIQPIVGLVHHGSGPRYTDLLSRDFATGVARHALRTAERYPWVTHWTPVNEPLTTARFSALYGHWYPHMHDERSFWLALLNQVDAIRYAMAAIRSIVPGAQLVQTEDLGHTFSTDLLAAQADFDNMRRWATWDLLEGRVAEGGPLYERIAAFGFAARLDAIASAPCPPDVVGINHYLTSDRFLDDRLELHPPESYGGNEFVRYADVAAARIAGAGGGLSNAIREAHARYGRPLALTEIHNGCTREEQMRWVKEAWSTAKTCRADGIKVIAVTAWSLLGACDWTSLLTEQRGDYESGVWDVRSEPPRETALAPLLRALAADRVPEHPVLDGSGWWSRTRRGDGGHPLLITGATGTLGQAIAGACRMRDIPYRLTTRQDLPIDDPDAVARILDETRPWVVINAAGWVRVDDAEHHRDDCMAANTAGTITLAQACAERGIKFTGFSSDLVFPGASERAYVEGDPTEPLNIYGHSKAEADRVLLGWDADILMIRTAAFFSAHDRHNFAMHTVDALGSGRGMYAASDVFVTPTFVPDLVRATLDLIIDGERGLWHLTNEELVSWHGFALAVARATGLATAGLAAVPASEMGWTAARPGAVALRSSRGRLLAPFEKALGQFARDLG